MLLKLTPSITASLCLSEWINDKHTMEGMEEADGDSLCNQCG